MENPPAVQAPQELEPAIVRIGPFSFSKQGMNVTEEPSFDTWAEATGRLTLVSEFSSYWLALLLAYGEHKFGEMYAQAIEATGKSYSYLANLVHTVRTIPQEDWRLPDITVEGHRLLAMIENRDERNAIRDEALAGNWNTPELRRIIELHQGHPQPIDFEGTVREETDGDEGDVKITPAPGIDRQQIHPGWAKVRIDYLEKEEQ